MYVWRVCWTDIFRWFCIEGFVRYGRWRKFAIDKCAEFIFDSFKFCLCCFQIIESFLSTNLDSFSNHQTFATSLLNLDEAEFNVWNVWMIGCLNLIVVLNWHDLFSLINDISRRIKEVLYSIFPSSFHSQIPYNMFEETWDRCCHPSLKVPVFEIPWVQAVSCTSQFIHSRRQSCGVWESFMSLRSAVLRTEHHGLITRTARVRSAR